MIDKGRAKKRMAPGCPGRCTEMSVSNLRRLTDSRVICGLIVRL